MLRRTLRKPCVKNTRSGLLFTHYVTSSLRMFHDTRIALRFARPVAGTRFLMQLDAASVVKQLPFVAVRLQRHFVTRAPPRFQRGAPCSGLPSVGPLDCAERARPTRVPPAESGEAGALPPAPTVLLGQH
jgi:hypothetical protein